MQNLHIILCNYNAAIALLLRGLQCFHHRFTLYCFRDLSLFLKLKPQVGRSRQFANNFETSTYP